jgi:hypothetical protein
MKARLAVFLVLQVMAAMHLIARETSRARLVSSPSMETQHATHAQLVLLALKQMAPA